MNDYREEYRGTKISTKDSRRGRIFFQSGVYYPLEHNIYYMIPPVTLEFERANATQRNVLAVSCQLPVANSYHGRESNGLFV
jgi:hypothetical protein